MSAVTVSAGLIGAEYHGAESSLKLRIYCRKTFTTTDLEPIVKSGVGSATFYKEVNCTVMSGVINHEEFTIDSTTDGVPNDSHYTFALFTDEGQGRGIVHKHIRVPPTPTPTTFGDLAIYSDLPVEELSITAYNAIINYINTIIAGLTNMATVATTAVKGATWMSAAPASAGHPIAVENNDPIIRAHKADVRPGRLRLYRFGTYCGFGRDRRCRRGPVIDEQSDDSERQLRRACKRPVSIRCRRLYHPGGHGLLNNSENGAAFGPETNILCGSIVEYLSRQQCDRRRDLA
jgi:hypothetical protein